MTAEPALTAVTTPVPLMVATDSSLLDQVTVVSKSPTLDTVAVRLTVSCGTSVACQGVTSTAVITGSAVIWMLLAADSISPFRSGLPAVQLKSSSVSASTVKGPVIHSYVAPTASSAVILPEAPSGPL